MAKVRMMNILVHVAVEAWKLYSADETRTEWSSGQQTVAITGLWHRGLSSSHLSAQPRPSELTGPARIQQLIAYLTPAAGAFPECSVPT